MKNKIIIALFFTFFATIMSAQTATDYFVKGADLYFNNKIEPAKAIVAKGLQMYPDDLKLKRLYDVLNNNKNNNKNEPPPPKEEKMSKDEAQQLLDAVLQSEKQPQKPLRRAKTQPEKDW